MSKALCSARGVTTKKIVDISETILASLSKIIDFEVSTTLGLIHLYMIGRRRVLTVERI